MLDTDLKMIHSWMNDPLVTLRIMKGCLYPLIEVDGYPMSQEKKDRANAFIQGLIADGVHQRVPRYTGRWTSPGFAISKASGRFRLVCVFRAVNYHLDVLSCAVNYLLQK